jgi:hypothetical protein
LPPPHHHTSEHSNFWTIILHGSHRSIGQTTHCQKPGPIFCSARAEPKTSTRIQTHQNLFTLTKNIFAPQQNQAGSKHPIFAPHPLRRVMQTKNRNSIFPITFYQWSVVSYQWSVFCRDQRSVTERNHYPRHHLTTDH